MTTIANGSSVDYPSPTLRSRVDGNPVECLPGAILWLPPKSQIPWTSGSDSLPPGCYNHPVVILDGLERGNVACLTLTSFDETSLAEARPYNAEVRSHYLPIAPSDPHPENGRLLYLDSQCKQPLRKNSYVNIKSLRVAPLLALRHYDWHAEAGTSDYVLGADSLYLLTICFQDLQAGRAIPAMFGGYGGTFGTSPPISVRHPSVTTPLLCHQESISPHTSEESSPFDYRPHGSFVDTQAIAMPSSNGWATQTWTNYGTNALPHAPVESSELAQRQRRTASSLSLDSGSLLLERPTNRQILEVLLAILGVCFLLYGLMFVLEKLGLWVFAHLKDALHLAKAVWVIFRDTVIQWIEDLKRHG